MALASGTLIETPDGADTVDRLRPGSKVVTLSGAVGRVRWVGQRVLFGRFVPRHQRQHLFPVRIPAGALGGGKPSCDLFVSTEQLLCFDEGLVSAGALLGHGGIAQVAPPDDPTDPMANAIRYFDVELFSHDVMRAAGAPAAAYLCRGDRNKFRNVADFFRLYGADATEQEPCRPVIADGALLAAIGARISRGGPSPAASAPAPAPWRDARADGASRRLAATPRLAPASLH